MSLTFAFWSASRVRSASCMAGCFAGFENLTPGIRCSIFSIASLYKALEVIYCDGSMVSLNVLFVHIRRSYWVHGIPWFWHRRLSVTICYFCCTDRWTIGDAWRRVCQLHTTPRCRSVCLLRTSWLPCHSPVSRIRMQKISNPHSNTNSSLNRCQRRSIRNYGCRAQHFLFLSHQKLI